MAPVAKRWRAYAQSLDSDALDGPPSLRPRDDITEPRLALHDELLLLSAETALPLRHRILRWSIRRYRHQGLLALGPLNSLAPT